MSKCSRAYSEAFFERLFAIANTSKLADDAELSFLKKLKHQVLSEDEEEELICRAAKEFTLDEAVREFGLTYSPSESVKHWWKIEELPDVKTFQPSACLVSYLQNYTRIYDRSSEAACRIGVDFLLCECIAAMQGKAHGISPTQSLTEDGRRTPAPWDTVNVHCEVSFTHTINPLPTISKKKSKKQNVQVSGRVDHGVGIVTWSHNVPNRRFHSLLLCIEAKFQGSLFNALTQLVVYLACLRQSRINRGRSNTSVYGVATDGLSYIFVTITHEGVLKKSNLFDVLRGGLSTVLGCLRYILEMAMSMSQNLAPEDADDVLNLDDIPFLHPDDEENEVGYY